MANRIVDNRIVTMMNALPSSEREALYTIAQEDDALFCEILGTMIRLAVVAKSGNMTAWKRLRLEVEQHLKSVNTFLEDSAREIS
jgi:hypothetical protein